MLTGRIPFSRWIHFAVFLFLAFFTVFFQGYVLAKSANPWLQVDLVTILIVYVSIEHFFLDAIILAFLTSMLLQSLSSVPTGFFVMYYLIVFVVASFLSRHFVLSTKINQFFAFAAFMILKYVLWYFVIVHGGREVDIYEYLLFVGPWFVTCLFAVPGFMVLANLDGYFEATLPRWHDDSFSAPQG